MTKKFIERVLHDGLVDTRNYRYVAEQRINGETVISRIPLNSLDTTAVYASADMGGWQQVMVLE